MYINSSDIKLLRFFSYTSGVYERDVIVELDWQDARELQERNSLERHPLYKLRDTLVKLALKAEVEGKYGKFSEIFYADNKTVFEFMWKNTKLYFSYYDGTYRLAVSAWQEYGREVDFSTKKYTEYYTETIRKIC